MVRSLIIDEEVYHLYYQILWFVQSAVLSNFKTEDDTSHQNWSAALNFYFDRLLTNTDRLAIMEVLQHYRNNKQEIDSSFQSAMTAFISELQGEREFIPFEERDFDKKMSNLSVSELKVVAYEVGRLSEAKAQHLLTILFHCRLLEQFGGREEQPTESRLIEEVTINLQSVIGFTFVSKQPLLNSPLTENGLAEGCRSFLACFDEISVAVKILNSG